jgi:hypothetical protein
MFPPSGGHVNGSVVRHVVEHFGDQRTGSRSARRNRES